MLILAAPLYRAEPWGLPGMLFPARPRTCREGRGTDKTRETAAYASGQPPRRL